MVLWPGPHRRHTPRFDKPKKSPQRTAHLSTYGIGADKSKQHWMSIGKELIQQGWLNQRVGKFPCGRTERALLGSPPGPGAGHAHQFKETKPAKKRANRPKPPPSRQAQKTKRALKGCGRCAPIGQGIQRARLPRPVRSLPQGTLHGTSRDGGRLGFRARFWQGQNRKVRPSLSRCLASNGCVTLPSYACNADVTIT